MKFSGRTWLKIRLKVRKKQGFILSLFLALENTFFVKPQGGSNCPPFPPSLFRVNITIVASDTRTLTRSEIGRYYSNNIIFCNPRTPKMYLCLMAVPHNAFKPAHKPAFSSLTTFARSRFYDVCWNWFQICTTQKINQLLMEP